MITIYTVPGSPYGRAVMIACEEKSLAWRIAGLGEGGSKGPEHLARHPFGRMPAIDHDGFGLYETQAIIRYIDQVGQGAALVPADAKAAARMNQALGVVDCYFFADGSGKTIGFHRVVAPKFGMPSDDGAVQAALPKAEHCIGVLADLVGQSPYVAGNTFSLADVMLASHLELFGRSSEGAAMIAGTPLAAYLERCESRPSFKRTKWEQLLQAA